ncbi:ribosomal protein L7/L12 [Escherichia coli]|uniref:ribosomal protein L7/L12 n=1 Tax=Escherichia coli TaxID=562 RepID=UPI003D9C9315
MKTVRDFTGLGLKEAKGLVEDCLEGRSCSVDVPFMKREAFMKEMKARGFRCA